MSDAANTLAFQIHHIFTGELFRSELADSLANLLATGPANITLDMAGNEIALFSNAAQAAAVQAAIAAGSTVHTNGGFGGSQHNGSHCTLGRA